ncbi:reverse transcriptase domain-containing protein, partial [Tanacetum coccineum]
MEQEVIKDIEETFKTLREINMKLNPKKCTFGMREGTFLGYKVNADGLKVCLDKVEVVLSLPSPKCLKDVQRLNGKLASLNRFLEVAYVNRTERERGINHLPGGCKGSYQCSPNDEKGRETSAHLLRQPCITRSKNKLLPNGKADTSSGEHDVHYRPSTSVKGQILADFIVERPKDDPPDTPMEDKEELPDPWILFTDGSSCIYGSRAGLILMNPEGAEFTYALRFRFDATNNEAKYEALIAGLRIVEQMGVKNLQANVDSRLMANQVNGSYIAKEPGMIKYLEKFCPPEQTSIIEELKEKSIDEKKVLAVAEEEEGRTWMTLIHEYLTEEIF